MAYRAEIEIAVKGANQLSSFQGKLRESALAVDNLNKFLETFTNKGEGVVRSVSNLKGQLGQAAQQFNEVALGTKEARTAAVNYLQANKTLNVGLQERAALLAEVAENERKVKLAAAGIRETTQFSGPIGPGQASDLLSGQSSPVRGLLERNLKIKQDELTLEKALLRLKERRSDAVFEELKNTESLVRGAKEVERVLQRQRGLNQFSEPVPIPGAANRRTRLQSERIAANLTAKSVERLAVQQRLKGTASGIVTQTKLQLELARKLGPAYNAVTAEFNRQLEIRKQSAKLAGQFSPIDGSESTPGSPAFLRARSRRRRDAASNALIGGAFPLLFGQGAGASVGGALGGGLGGLAGGQFGFGLSLVGTGVGQAFDTLIAKASELGKALDPVNGDVDAVIESVGLANEPLGKLIKGFEELAGKEAALEIATAELANLVGNDGVEALKDFGEASVELGNSLQKVATQLAASVTKTLQGPLEFLAKQSESVSLRRQAFQSNDPRIVRLREQIGNRQSPRNNRDIEVLREIEQIQRQINEDNERASQKELESKINALSPANELLDTAERNLKIARLQDDILDDQVFKLKQQQIEADLSVGIAELRKKAEGNVLLKLSLQKDEKRLQIEADTKLLELTQQRDKAQANLNKNIERDQERSRRERERADREAKRNAERIERERVQKAQAFAQASLSLVEASVSAARVDKGDLGAIERELKLIKIKKGLQEDVILLAKEDIKTQNLRFDILDQETKIRVRLLNLERERIKLSIEQQKIDEQRNQRSQIESVRRESFGFTAQLADPFNREPGRLRAAESELRKNNILRSEREKLADLEREGASISPFASAESVKRLAEQIDAQKAFIPQLEAELTLRNQLENAAARQSEIIEKYGFIADEVATAVSSSVQAIVTGTGSIEEAFSTLFQNIGRAFVDLATQVLAQKAFLAVINALNPGAGLFGGGGGGNFLQGVNNPLKVADSSGFNLGGFFANGGNPPVNRPSIVGERGPELFVPRSSGTIVPNETLDALGRYRPTSSAGAASQTVNVNYSVTEVNGMRYVTEEQFRAGLDQAAKRGANMGKTMTISTLRNSRSQRSKIGL